MTLGTRIVVMKDGVVQQVDTPQNLYPCGDGELLQIKVQINLCAQQLVHPYG